MVHVNRRMVTCPKCSLRIQYVTRDGQGTAEIDAADYISKCQELLVGRRSIMVDRRRRRFHFSEIRFGANDGARAFGASDRSCGRRRAH
jgi:hypothetical protein